MTTEKLTVIKLEDTNYKACPTILASYVYIIINALKLFLLRDQPIICSAQEFDLLCSKLYAQEYDLWSISTAFA